MTCKSPLEEVAFLISIFKPTMSVYNSKEKRILSWTALDAWAPSVRRKVAFSPAGSGSCQGCMGTRGAPRKGIQCNDNEETTKEKKIRAIEIIWLRRGKPSGKSFLMLKVVINKYMKTITWKQWNFICLFFWKFWEPCLRKVDPNLQCNWSFWKKNLYLK